jgi:hypothetical protein
MSMEVLIYKKEYDSVNSNEVFLDFYYSLHMNYLASDLLNKGLSPKQISDAVIKAIKIARLSGVDIRKHFMPVFTELNKSIISDCKLSKMSYGLVLLNADSDLSAVGEWQMRVLQKFLD